MFSKPIDGLLEMILIQLLIQNMNSFGFSMSRDYQVKVLLKAGLTEEEIKEAL